MQSEIKPQEWALAQMNGVAVSAVVPTLAISADGTISGSAGCNRYTGTYEYDGKQIALKTSGSTRKLCPPASMQVEKRFLLALEQVSNYREFDGTLTLSSPKGDRLIFDLARVR